MTARIPHRIKVLYGIADSGIAMLTSIVQFFLLFYYTDIALLDAGLVGTALMVGKFTWDAFNDVVFGYVSDRTRSRWGRRRPYLLFLAIPLALSTWLLFSIPARMSGFVAFFVVLFTFLLFDTIHTFVAVAYTAMTPELTYDYDERTNLTTVREIFTVVGYILGAALTVTVADAYAKNLGLSPQASYSAMGLTFGVYAAAVVLITAFSVKEKPVSEVQPSKMPAIKAFVQTFKNKPFVQLVAAFLIANVSFTLLTTLLPYYLKYQVNMEEQMAFIMLALLLTIGVFLYPMKMIADRIGKGKAYALGLAVAAVAILTLFFVPKGPTPYVYVAAIVAGMGLSAQWVCPWSMVPDVIEIDEAATGERREGIYYGMWNFITKFANALAIAAVGWTLAGFGYVPNVAQSDFTLLGIRILFCLVPVLMFVLTMPLLIKYPITRESHAKLVAELRD
ncbi:MAG TPA: glycoside-pentoside-hexuronide (GPH):cation symporter [Anaerolineae bacterium]|nr:glycoside-pentoside-hexuronide (GPH):cation symporter [Anaerolineae bacterium]HPL28491.1 glycoside-pentoside-hexuronide (GPH):cation symporter [Anaerolineae bacterium]